MDIQYMFGVLPPADLIDIDSIDAVGLGTLLLAGGTFWLAFLTLRLLRAAKEDRETAIKALETGERQAEIAQRTLDAENRPLLVDVLEAGPILDDMGARPNPNVVEHRREDQPFTISTRLPGRSVEEIDPRSVWVSIERGMVYLSVPLRNVGRGLAVIDGSGVDIRGAAIGQLRHRDVQRYHVPVNETTRIDLIAAYLRDEPIDRGEVWHLRVPYTDVAGEQRSNAQVQLSCPEGPMHAWCVIRVDQEPGVV